jgi:hypothetical protein
MMAVIVLIAARRWLAPLMLGLALIAAPAWGFSVPTHGVLTGKALDHLQACGDRLGEPTLRERIAQLRAAQPLLIQCNQDQDRLIRKAAVWHFLPSPGKPSLDPDQQQVPVCPLEPSLRPWFAALAAVSDQAVGASAPQEAYALLGAMLHYLQDMAVPTHVLPIFHPVRWIESDAFDDYLPASDGAGAPDCARLALARNGDQSLPEQLTALLEETAATTRAAIAEGAPISGAPPSGWNRFWLPEVAADGFSRYGCVGNRFGAGQLHCEGQALSVEPGVYQRLALKLQTEAITASARAMLIFLRRVAPPSAPAPQLCPLPMPCKGGGLCGARPREWRQSARWNVFARSSELPVTDETSQRPCGAWPLPFGVAAYLVAALVASPVLVLALLLRRWRRRRRAAT